MQAVPLAVLGRLLPVPAAYLKQLATDSSVFPELPENVQRQARLPCRSGANLHTSFSVVAVWLDSTKKWELRMLSLQCLLCV